MRNRTLWYHYRSRARYDQAPTAGNPGVDEGELIGDAEQVSVIADGGQV